MCIRDRVIGCAIHLCSDSCFKYNDKKSKKSQICRHNFFHLLNLAHDADPPVQPTVHERACQYFIDDDPILCDDGRLLDANRMMMIIGMNRMMRLTRMTRMRKITRIVARLIRKTAKMTRMIILIILA